MPLVCSTLRGQKGVLEPLELELQVVVNVLCSFFFFFLDKFSL